MIRHTLLLRRVTKLLLLFLIGKTTCFAVSSGDASCAQDIRGGSAIVSSIDEGTISIIKQFLASSSEKNQKNNDFLIQGWRWHVMSLIRDAGRLKSLAEHLAKNNMSDDPSLDALVTAADYVVNFNMAGLYRVESTMFVKWLRKHLCRPDAFGDDSNAAATSNAYGNVIGKIEDQRIDCENLGKELYDKANAASSSITLEERRQHLQEIVRLSTRLLDELHSMRTLQETLLVPAISQIVSSRDQKSFNNKVLFNLGVLESRVHLVGMHDAVFESGSEVEKEKFQKEIPYVARMMIERWRKSLYAPKGAWALDHISR